LDWLAGGEALGKNSGVLSTLGPGFLVALFLAPSLFKLMNGGLILLPGCALRVVVSKTDHMTHRVTNLIPVEARRFQYYADMLSHISHQAVLGQAPKPWILIQIVSCLLIP
jgi:hypothetical protein